MNQSSRFKNTFWWDIEYAIKNFDEGFKDISKISQDKITNVVHIIFIFQD